MQPSDAETGVGRHQKLLMKEICRTAFSPAAGCALQGLKMAFHGGCGLALFDDLTAQFHHGEGRQDKLRQL